MNTKLHTHSMNGTRTPKDSKRFRDWLFSSLNRFESLGVLLGALLLAAPAARADVDRHAAQDAFDAEVAKLLPQPDLVFTAAATPPAQRSTLGEWGAVIPWTPHIPVSAATLPNGRILTFASNERSWQVLVKKLLNKWQVPSDLRFE